ncbi:MAG: MATE family efflux transporter [Bacteroidota bacterium]|nr:MATE family efflux transporter [Bacteroidota bacterium]
MITTYSGDKSIRGIFSFIREALSNKQHDFTSGSIRKAVFLLAIPMILEMCMESVFAVVDIFFVGKLGSHATASVGLTESVLAIVYSLAFGLSMGATAIVARRVGEKNLSGAAKAGAQAIILAILLSVLISLTGILFPKDVLRLMGATPEIVETGYTYTRIMLTGNLVILMLFLLNGIFRGAGNATIAMRSLWLANICNIILCPLLIHQFGLNGAAMATTTGRSIGVLYQLWHILKGKSVIKISLHHFLPDKDVIKNLLKVASTASLQFLIGSASWIAMARIMTDFGSDAVAGYTIAIRWIVFFILPAFGLSNAAATLVGQNLGAGHPDRAEQSVWKTAKYNAIFMGFVSLLFLVCAEFFVSIITTEPAVVDIAVLALRIVSLGYVFYGIGMVMMNAFNGAGDSRTPTWVNLFWFWAFQIPLAYLVAVVWHWGPKGVFIAIVVTEACITITSVLLFRRGKWKQVKV